MDLYAIRESKKQQNVRNAFTASVVVAGVVPGIFFLWLAFATQMDFEGTAVPLLDGFLRTLSFFFGVALIGAAVTFPFLER